MSRQEFETAVSENGYAVVDGVIYAIGEKPYLVNLNSEAAFIATGFSKTSPGYENVVLCWDCTEWYNKEDDEDFECDWKTSAKLI